MMMQLIIALFLYSSMFSQLGDHYIFYYIKLRILQFMGNKYTKHIEMKINPQIVLNATKIQFLLSQLDKEGYKPTIIWQSDFILPSSYPFRSSQQIENNRMTVIHSISTQGLQNVPVSFNNKWPQTCIGLILFQHHQNNKKYYVYGTGTLIHKNIVLTSDKNAYCRRLQKEYINIKFITGVNANKCSGIYDVMRVQYPKEYTKKEGYKNYDYAILQLYNDLSDCCGYVGWKTNYRKENKDDLSIFGYITDRKQRFFNLISLKLDQKQKSNKEGSSGHVVFIKEKNQQYILGLYSQQLDRYNILTQLMRNMINEWTKHTKLELCNNNLKNSCNQIVKYSTRDMNQLKLYGNKIDAQGCKYLSKAHWTHLTSLKLYSDNIDAQGCKYLSKAYWTYLAHIDLRYNEIGAQGCRYISQANWKHLNYINLRGNDIDTQGCRHISQANWAQTTSINLSNSHISSQGCKYLSQANWKYLNYINLQGNNIGSQGCRYLIQSDWAQCTFINLQYNNINSQGCKYLRQANWKYQNNIYLREQNFKKVFDVLILMELFKIIQIRLQ